MMLARALVFGTATSVTLPAHSQDSETESRVSLYGGLAQGFPASRGKDRDRRDTGTIKLLMPISTKLTCAALSSAAPTYAAPS